MIKCSKYVVGRIVVKVVVEAIYFVLFWVFDSLTSKRVQRERTNLKRFILEEMRLNPPPNIAGRAGRNYKQKAW